MDRLEPNSQGEEFAFYSVWDGTPSRVLRRGLGCPPYRLTVHVRAVSRTRQRGEGQSQEKVRGAGGQAMGHREGRSAPAFILKVRLVGLEDGLDEDHEGMEGSGRLQAVLPEQQGGWRGKTWNCVCLC